MEKIVYLLGAGASRGTRDAKDLSFKYELLTKEGYAQYGFTCSNILSGLPVVNEIPGRLSLMLSCLASSKKKFQEKRIEDNNLNSLIEDIVWLKDNTERHASVDTFAKKLYLIDNQNDYFRLKRALVVYLTYEQYNKPDGRYDSFFASILGKDKDDLPQNISILSWNYDCQVEMAYEEYLRSDNIATTAYYLHEFDKTTARMDDNPYHKQDGFKVIKLNGTALINNGSYFGKDKHTDVVQSLIDLYKEITPNNMRLSFAWERMGTKFQTLISDSITDADVLVIIGYSFPFFNREVDRLIFKSMPNLKKIYIQDPNAEKIKIGIKSVLQESTYAFQHIEMLEPDAKQFFLPPEL